MVFNIKKVIAAALFTSGVFCLQAQPVAIKQQLPAVGNDATITISGYTSAQLDAIDNAPSSKPQPLSVGRLMTANYTPQTTGQWQKVYNGRIWRMKVVAKDAKGVSFYGKVNHLPKGAQLNIYDTKGTQWVNAYTEKNFSKHNILSSEAVQGEEAIIEYFEPDGVNDEPQFVIEKVGYMFREEKTNNAFQRKDFGSSDGCQVNVNCPEGKGWESSASSVVRIKVLNDLSIVWCSGTLIISADKKFKPYILSAMHCGLTANEKEFINDTLFKYWVFYFNYQSPTCANPISEGNLADNNIVGAEVKATSDDLGGEYGSDFLLMELSSRVPTAWKAYYSGWNLDTTAQYTSGVTIHHPSGDIKKISTYTWPLKFEAPFPTSPDNTHWEAFWSATANGHGTTEGGSSGSALFDNNGLILGTLTGGNSSCSNKAGTDLFGRMDWHWTRNGTDSTKQLKHWLDPLNTGAISQLGSFEEPESVQGITALPLILSPNPASTTLVFESEWLNNSLAQVQILNVLGQHFYSIPNNNNSVDISALPQGVYFITIHQKNNYFTAKFIKQ